MGRISPFPSQPKSRIVGTMPYMYSQKYEEKKDIGQASSFFFYLEYLLFVQCVCGVRCLPKEHNTYIVKYIQSEPGGQRWTSVALTRPGAVNKIDPPTFSALFLFRHHFTHSDSRISPRRTTHLVRSLHLLAPPPAIRAPTGLG